MRACVKNGVPMIDGKPDARARRLMVFVNGKHMPGVVEADDIEGYVLRFDVPHDPRQRRLLPLSRLRIERIYGTVRFEERR